MYRIFILRYRAYNTCHVNAVFIISVRAGEALSIRIKDLDLDSNPSKLFVRREYAKTRTDTTIFLTDEVAHQLKSWLDYKYRTRRIYHTGEQDWKTITEYIRPAKKDTELIFAVYQIVKT